MIAFKARQREADVMARTWTLPPRPGGRRWRTCWAESPSCPDVSRRTRHISYGAGGSVVARLVSPAL